MNSENGHKETGKRYWRSAAQMAESPEVAQFIEREFPEGASELNDPISRRKFLGIMGASAALAGLVSCRRPVQKIVPYVIQPEDITPGIPQYYATTMPFGLSAYGLLVESHEGRPTKVEGNDRHPSSLGSSNAQILASTLTLYDPDRNSKVTQGGAEKSWDDFVSTWRRAMPDLEANGGEGLAVLAEPSNSPTLARLKANFKKKYPKTTWTTYEALSDENIHNGIATATGGRYLPVYDVEEARVILSLDSDFLGHESENITAARGFADGRKALKENDPMNRLYVAESGFTITGTMADHRLRLRSADVADLTLALAGELESQGLGIPALRGKRPSKSFHEKWISALAKDLLDNRGACLIVAGRRQPEPVHALVAALNKALNSVVRYHEAPYAQFSSLAEFKSLVEKMKSGAVKTLLIIGGNPSYASAGAIDFDGALKKVEQAIHLGMSSDETSALCEWHVPQAHFLEAWGDAVAVDGTESVIQPLIEPLFGGKSDVEFLNFLITGADIGGYAVTRESWKAKLGQTNFEKKWEVVLHDGLLAGSGTSPQRVSINSTAVSDALSGLKVSEGLEASFAPSNVYDGRFSNNGWLQELPDPITKNSWDNVATMSAKTAEQLGVATGDVVTVSHDGAGVDLPVFILPGQADDSVSLALGYGRTAAGTIGNGVGTNVYPLFNAGFVTGVSVARTGRRHTLANTQDHGTMEGRPIVREGTLEEYRAHPAFAAEMDVETPAMNSLWSEHTYDKGYQWGMTVDLNSCTGCNACTIACQSENNTPIVGREQVHKGREMHWMRMDRYFTGDDMDNPEIVHQPMACQQCEMAPCEQVCPVAATVHDSEGLNVMVYNRCIGTRYCSNNCPYKVRRFNFFNYTKDTPEVTKMAMNPDVTVRSRGVMEKCTYCVQRISRAKILAKREGRDVRDGEIVTACQQACPTKAIVFGNINDPKSEVSRIKKENKRNYQVLKEFNTRPRTSYLAKLRNPNPALPTTVSVG